MNRSFYALLISQTSTNLGFALYTMIVVLHLFNETGSTALSAAVTLVSVIARMGREYCLDDCVQPFYVEFSGGENEEIICKL